MELSEANTVLHLAFFHTSPIYLTASIKKARLTGAALRFSPILFTTLVWGIRLEMWKLKSGLKCSFLGFFRLWLLKLFTCMDSVLLAEGGIMFKWSLACLGMRWHYCRKPSIWTFNSHRFWQILTCSRVYFHLPSSTAISLICSLSLCLNCAVNGATVMDSNSL